MIRPLALFALAALAADPQAEVFGGEDSGVEAPAAPAGPSAGPIGAMPPEVVAAAEAAAGRPLVERLEAVTTPLLDRPYIDSPLGEGDGLDPDPLARYDAFDCLTFVEEALALALSGDPVHAADVRMSLRYAGPPSYATRRHFMELQWLPDAVANRWLRDTTAEYGPVTTYTRDVTPGLWKAWGRRSLFALTDEELPIGPMRVDFLPLADAIAAVPRIRPGSIVLVVREDRPWVPLWITHLGIVLQGDPGVPRVRDASRIRSSMKTRDHKLSSYVEYLGTYVNWKSAGIAVYEPIEDAPRRSRVPPDWNGPAAMIAWDDGRTSSSVPAPSP